LIPPPHLSPSVRSTPCFRHQILDFDQQFDIPGLLDNQRKLSGAVADLKATLTLQSTYSPLPADALEGSSMVLEPEPRYDAEMANYMREALELHNALRSKPLPTPSAPQRSHEDDDASRADVGWSM
jgi:hypothetical protein